MSGLKANQEGTMSSKKETSRKTENEVRPGFSRAYREVVTDQSHLYVWSAMFTQEPQTTQGLQDMQAGRAFRPEDLLQDTDTLPNL